MTGQGTWQSADVVAESENGRAATCHDVRGKPRSIRAPRGPEISCKGWQQEAALRMLMNSLDPDVAERPEDLIVYGGTGRAARSWEAFDAIVDELRCLEDDQTLLIQSGKPVAVLRTHEWAPRVLLANGLVVPEWCTQDEFRRLEAAGLTMFGQMTAGSWAYIGSQGILQSTYATFDAVGQQTFNGDLSGTLTLTAGLGGMGGAQPLAVTMNGGVVICVEVDQRRIDRRLGLGYLDIQAESLEDAFEIAAEALAERRPLSIGLRGHAATVAEMVVSSGLHVDIVTDQTAAHDPLYYVPDELSPDEANRLRAERPDEYLRRARQSIGRHVEAMVKLQDRGAVVFEYGNCIRAEAKLAGVDRAFEFPGFVAAYIRPFFLEAKGHCRWIALSGDPDDILKVDEALQYEFADNVSLCRWLRLAKSRSLFQGLPARTCMLGYGERSRAGKVINDMVARGELSGPLVIGREHLDAGSVASPYRETEGMVDGSDAIADWPVLNALVNVSSGASWVSVHQGGGVGVGRSVHAGLMVVADGSELAAQKVERTLTNDPATGVVRYVDAGYQGARTFASLHGLGLLARS